MSLKSKTIRAIIIILAGHGAQQIIRFVGNLVTTRLLAPELFGAMLIANSIYTLVVLLSDMGLSLSIIKNKNGEDPTFLRTVFSLKVLQGFFLFSIIVLAALCLIIARHYSLIPIGSALAHEDLPIALIIISFAALINGFQSIQIDVHRRHQALGKLTSLTLLAQIISVVFVITSALQFPSIYSLALANVVSAAVLCAGSYIIFDRKNFGFAWSLAHVKQVFSFGKWITASSIIVGVINSTDKFLFGYLLTGAQMGFYAIASLISSAIDRVFKKMNDSLFPALSEVLRESPEKASDVYYKIRLYRDAITCFPACMLICNGDVLISLLYDERYTSSGLFLQFLGVVPLIDSFLFKNQLITASGNSKIQFQTAIWRLAAMVLLIPIAYYFYGLTGALTALVTRRLFGSWLLFIEFQKLGYLRLTKELRTVGIIAAWLIVGISIKLLIEYFGVGV